MTIPGAIVMREAPAEVRTLLNRVLQIMEPQARAQDVSLAVEVADNAPDAVVLDADRIAWALTTLVGNALRYVRHGSKTMPGGSILIRAAFDVTADRLTIEVQDDGPGIPAETVRRLVGFGVEASQAGLGLAMVRDVVAAHGGAFDIVSETAGFRHGTTVRLTLPAA